MSSSTRNKSWFWSIKQGLKTVFGQGNHFCTNLNLSFLLGGNFENAFSIIFGIISFGYEKHLPHFPFPEYRNYFYCLFKPYDVKQTN